MHDGNRRKNSKLHAAVARRESVRSMTYPATTLLAQRPAVAGQRDRGNTSTPALPRSRSLLEHILAVTVIAVFYLVIGVPPL